ncbi:hypothetical protein QJS66_16010 [Kocuria rhizophila]|nr:hypothetical protein QJS66_16010 [Kocuria rhizophila]
MAHRFLRREPAGVSAAGSRTPSSWSPAEPAGSGSTWPGVRAGGRARRRELPLRRRSGPAGQRTRGGPGAGRPGGRDRRPAGADMVTSPGSTRRADHGGRGTTPWWTSASTGTPAHPGRGQGRKAT